MKVQSRAKAQSYEFTAGDLHLTVTLSQHLLRVNSKHKFLTKTNGYTACIIPPLGGGKEDKLHMTDVSYIT